MTTMYKAVEFTKDRIKESERVVTGWVSRIYPDEIGDVMMPMGADCTYLDKTKSVNLYHDQNRPIGVHRNYEKKSDGILVTFQVGRKTRECDEAWEMIQQGILRALSIEYTGDLFGPPTGEEVKRFGDGARRVYRRWKLRGYGVVSQPCNADALITETKARVNEYLEGRVRAGKCSMETAVALGLEVEPKAPEPKRLFVAGGLSWMRKAG